MMKFVYAFSEGNKDMRDILGGKGANLAEMKGMGLPVPDGFTVSTMACNRYYEDGDIDSVIREEIEKEIYLLEMRCGKTLGGEKPLLLSIRSGARSSMPGMMDTILNLGLNDEVVKVLEKNTNNRRFAYDSYRRFIQMYSDVVMGYSKKDFERVIDEYKSKKGVKFDIELDAEDMVSITERFKGIYKELSGEDFPSNPKEQIMNAIKAVFRSWMNERAIVYRKMNDIPDDWGTAVNVQEMVYGNMGETSGTGVAFTRSPITGEDVLYGDYLINAQGEDVVAGVRTPSDISTLKEVMPNIYNEFLDISKKLEKHYRDMQDMEFTIENGKLYILQTRSGKRTGMSAIRIATSLVNEGMISKEEAIMRVDANQIEQLLHPTFLEDSLKRSRVLTKGVAASPGCASGRIYFDPKEVEERGGKKERVILVRLETSPEDIKAMIKAQGVLTIRGGKTSHAAVVARGMGKCCVSGCEGARIDEEKRCLLFPDGTIVKEGEFISLDGMQGLVYEGEIKTKEAEISGDFETFMAWVDEARRLGVRANADNERDAMQARKFGAEGIGLCRTEHMFFDTDRIFNFRKMIVATNKEDREAALEKILPYQEGDFEKLFIAMEGYPVIIRYLDPPLHEFLPKTEDEIRELSVDLGISYEELRARVEGLKEFNPMMGHRGCRLLITYPEIIRMQTRAVIGAAIKVKDKGMVVKPEIMIPLVGDVKELRYVKEIVVEEADRLLKESGASIDYKVGTMIEVPRAALLSDEIAKEADFFSYGTNDMTQMTFGFSRDDSAKFLKDYYDKGILESDPFASIDTKGVGKMLTISSELARGVNKSISLGICGEHGGDSKSIEFCNDIGLDYVSCSPYRVPVARLAAARCEIMRKNGNK